MKSTKKIKKFVWDEETVKVLEEPDYDARRPDKEAIERKINEIIKRLNEIH